MNEDEGYHLVKGGNLLAFKVIFGRIFCITKKSYCLVLLFHEGARFENLQNCFLGILIREVVGSFTAFCFACHPS